MVQQLPAVAQSEAPPAGRQEETTAMMKGARVKAEAPKPSPLADFVLTLKAMARNRFMIAGLVAAVSDWTVVLQDIEMMLNEGVIAGLRSYWVRRVAVPVFQADRALQADEPNDVKARKALEILGQCTDVKVQDTCMLWIEETYGVRRA